jgi:hypothetical protein
MTWIEFEAEDVPHCAPIVRMFEDAPVFTVTLLPELEEVGMPYMTGVAVRTVSLPIVRIEPLVPTPSTRSSHSASQVVFDQADEGVVIEPVVASAVPAIPP